MNAMDKLESLAFEFLDLLEQQNINPNTIINQVFAAIDKKKQNELNKYLTSLKAKRSVDTVEGIAAATTYYLFEDAATMENSGVSVADIESATTNLVSELTDCKKKMHTLMTMDLSQISEDGKMDDKATIRNFLRDL